MGKKKGIYWEYTGNTMGKSREESWEDNGIIMGIYELKVNCNIWEVYPAFSWDHGNCNGSCVQLKMNWVDLVIRLCFVPLVAVHRQE